MGAYGGLRTAAAHSARQRTGMVLCLIALLALPALNGVGLCAQTRTISGTVRDAATNELLPAATIRLAGSSRGTLTNARGEFQFPLYQAPAVLVVSYVGYKTDSLDLASVDAAQSLSIRLQPISIQLPGVTVTDEDPAYEIIRRAIEHKRQWMQSLERFEGKAFTRMTLRSDTSIASITESYSTLFWSQHDTLREVITQTRKTGNLPAGFQASNVGAIMNFNDDEIPQLGFRFTGPTAPSAFDYYDYKLLRTRVQDDFDVYDIQLLPRSRSTPLFYGRISIAERSYAVVEVDVRPNEAFVIPFIKLNGVRYRQHFSLYENRFWLPADYRTEGSLSVSFAGLKMPAIGLEKDVVIYDYAINPVFADSISVMKLVTYDSSANRLDSAFWAQTNVLPLTDEQERAYSTLDSTQTLERKFKPSGAAVALAGAATGSILGFIDVYFNRVEGLHLGVDHAFVRVGGLVDLRAMLGYGTSDKVWKYSAGVTFPFGWEKRASVSSGFSSASSSARQFAIGGDVYRTLGLLPEEKPYSFFSNSVAALVSKLDYYDYYEREGWKTALSYHPMPVTSTSIEYKSEENRSLLQHTDYSILGRSRRYRQQPVIDDGHLRAVTVSLSYGQRLLLNFMPQAFVFDAGIEYADRGTLGGDYSYKRYTVSAQAKVRTMGADLLFPQSLYIKASLGTSGGSLPLQRTFDILSGLGGYGQIGTFKGLKPHEFQGDWFASLNLEHNFRRAPFLWLGITPLYETNWEFIATASCARAANNSLLYYEAGVGINNIFDLLRVDLTWRFTSPGGFVFSLSLADLISGLL
ncbi:MAG TPA: DUF5686 family protein [Bacteroidota bacterium]|nr:DUF5686 family protein [Bacteroidota bacterium]